MERKTMPSSSQRGSTSVGFAGSKEYSLWIAGPDGTGVGAAEWLVAALLKDRMAHLAGRDPGPYRAGDVHDGDVRNRSGVLVEQIGCGSCRASQHRIRTSYF